MKLVIIQIILLISVQVHALVDDPSFVEGLQVVKASAQFDLNEKMYIYIKPEEIESLQCISSSNWVNVEVSHSSGTIVWMDVGGTIKNINKYFEAKKNCSEIRYTIYLMHTHPKKSIKSNYLKSNLFNSNYFVDWSNDITVPPSISDLNIISRFNSVLIESLKVDISFSLVGVVADPIGLYFYRIFLDDEIMNEYPGLEIIDFSSMDNEEYELQFSNLVKEIEGVGSDWSTLLNSGAVNIKAAYQNLKKSYAKYRIKIDFIRYK